jgi:hypothetical protein
MSVYILRPWLLLSIQFIDGVYYISNDGTVVDSVTLIVTDTSHPVKQRHKQANRSHAPVIQPALSMLLIADRSSKLLFLSLRELAREIYQ